MSRSTRVVLTALALIWASALALLSVSVERTGPELVQYGDADFKPVLKGGFPFAYLVDAPGISVERQLAFFEDTLHAGPLILDIAIYFAILLLPMLVVARRRATRKQAPGRIGT